MGVTSTGRSVQTDIPVRALVARLAAEENKYQRLTWLNKKR